MKRDVAMTTNIYGRTAKIYQFPTRAETGIGENRDKAKPVASVADATSQRFADAADGSGWYHEAAIQEAERTRKH
jgi:hypothetical protein